MCWNYQLGFLLKKRLIEPINTFHLGIIIILEMNLNLKEDAKLVKRSINQMYEARIQTFRYEQARDIWTLCFDIEMLPSSCKLVEE
jgi:hypothetical protein